MYKLVKVVNIERQDSNTFYMECEGTKLHIEFDRFATPAENDELCEDITKAYQVVIKK